MLLLAVAKMKVEGELLLCRESEENVGIRIQVKNLRERTGCCFSMERVNQEARLKSFPIPKRFVLFTKTLALVVVNEDCCQLSA